MDHSPGTAVDRLTYAFNTLAEDMRRVLVVAYTSAPDTHAACARYEALKSDILSLAERYGVSTVVSDHIVEMERLFDIEALKVVKRESAAYFCPPDPKVLYIKPHLQKFLRTTV